MKSEGLTPAQLAERNAELPRITQEKAFLPLTLPQSFAREGNSEQFSTTTAWFFTAIKNHRVGKNA
ncbi:hypothetical protein [Escherichia coli]|uniref:hypothetical protein n=1 Tax=Escherichia coli TaxID=562 RepID=UPI0030C72427